MVINGDKMTWPHFTVPHVPSVLNYTLRSFERNHSGNDKSRHRSIKKMQIQRKGINKPHFPWIYYSVWWEVGVKDVELVFNRGKACLDKNACRAYLIVEM